MKYPLTEKLLEIYDSKKERSRTSHILTVEEYNKFKNFCAKRGITTSDLLDLLIKDFNTQHAEETDSE